ncbi:hypothetical protein Ae201684P_010118 [Aphanomyces euteiches]|nr:hypothetical protein Ae201684P_010118 [Aphanomyces euteiches]
MDLELSLTDLELQWLANALETSQNDALLEDSDMDSLDEKKQLPAGNSQPPQEDSISLSVPRSEDSHQSTASDIASGQSITGNTCPALQPRPPSDVGPALSALIEQQRKRSAFLHSLKRHLDVVDSSRSFTSPLGRLRVLRFESRVASMVYLLKNFRPGSQIDSVGIFTLNNSLSHDGFLPHLVTFQHAKAEAFYTLGQRLEFVASIDNDRSARACFDWPALTCLLAQGSSVNVRDGDHVLWRETIECKYVSYQICHATINLHSAQIIHRVTRKA